MVTFDQNSGYPAPRSSSECGSCRRLAREDLIQATGTVEKILGGGSLSDYARNGSIRDRSALGPHAPLPHPRDPGRPRTGRTLALRSEPRLHHLPAARRSESDPTGLSGVGAPCGCSAAPRDSALGIALRLASGCARWRIPGSCSGRVRAPTSPLPRYLLEPGARVVFVSPGVHADRTPGGLVFVIAGRDAQIEIGAGTLAARRDPSRCGSWRSRAQSCALGPDSFLNGCHLSAKRSVRLGRRAWVGLGSRVFDSDQHDLRRRSQRADRRGRDRGLRVGRLRRGRSSRACGSGSHSIVGTRSLVTRDVPDHSLAFRDSRDRAREGRGLNSTPIASPVLDFGPGGSREAVWLRGKEAPIRARTCARASPPDRLWR